MSNRKRFLCGEGLKEKKKKARKRRKAIVLPRDEGGAKERKDGAKKTNKRIARERDFRRWKIALAENRTM